MRGHACINSLTVPYLQSIKLIGVMVFSPVIFVSEGTVSKSRSSPLAGPFPLGRLTIRCQSLESKPAVCGYGHPGLVVTVRVASSLDQSFPTDGGGWVATCVATSRCLGCEQQPEQPELWMVSRLLHPLRCCVYSLSVFFHFNFL